MEQVVTVLQKPDLKSITTELKVLDNTVTGVSWDGSGKLIVYEGNSLTQQQILATVAKFPTPIVPPDPDGPFYAAIAAAATLQELKDVLLGKTTDRKIPGRPR